MGPAVPFEFEQGMTLDQLERTVGPLVVARRSTSVYHTARAPKVHSSFKRYILFIAPDRGLAKVLALGRAIPTDGFGKAIRFEFERLQAELSEAYGEGKTSDFVRAAVRGAWPWWESPEQFTWGLVRHARVLATLWTHGQLPARAKPKLVRLPGEVKAMRLAASALLPTRGRVMLGYEFSNWDALAPALWDSNP